MGYAVAVPACLAAARSARLAGVDSVSRGWWVLGWRAELRWEPLAGLYQATIRELPGVRGDRLWEGRGAGGAIGTGRP